MYALDTHMSLTIEQPPNPGEGKFATLKVHSLLSTKKHLFLNWQASLVLMFGSIPSVRLSESYTEAQMVLPPTFFLFKRQGMPHLDNLARRGEEERKGYLYSGKDDWHPLAKCLVQKIPQTLPKHSFRIQGVPSHPTMLPVRPKKLKKKKSIYLYISMLLLVVF